eukprot:207099-Hanusia_phi.AAC.4
MDFRWAETIQQDEKRWDRLDGGGGPTLEKFPEAVRGRYFQERMQGKGWLGNRMENRGGCSKDPTYRVI